MKTVKRIEEGYFNATGSTLLENGCIEFTHYIIGHRKFADCSPDDVVKNVLSNPSEKGSEFNRIHYIESVNSWLKMIDRPDIQINFEYKLETLRKLTTANICKCGNKWTETETDDSSDESKIYPHGEVIFEYVEQNTTNNVESCSLCEMDKRIKGLIPLVDGLDKEVTSRQTKAMVFFESHPEYSPSDYEVVRKSPGFNPTAKNRSGCEIGRTSRGAYVDHVCYMIKK